LGASRAQAFESRAAGGRRHPPLASADFIDSDLCIDAELAPAIARHDAGTAHVITIAIRAAGWGNLPFAVAQEIRRVVAARRR